MGRAIEWKLGPTAVAALLVAMLSACASTSESVGVSSSLKDCEPGELRVCECLSGSGVQVCDDEGDDFGACECSDQGAGGNAAGGGGATSSSSSSATASSTGSGDPCAGQGHCGNSLQDCGETGVDCGSDCFSRYADWRVEFDADRKSTRLNSSHTDISRMPSSA